jgi:hypothetical protein
MPNVLKLSVGMMWRDIGRTAVDELNEMTDGAVYRLFGVLGVSYLSGNNSLTHVYYFYIPEWEDEAKKDRNMLKNYYGISNSEVHLIKVENNQDFYNGWNAMGEENGKIVSIECVVINSHGNPNTIGDKDGLLFSMGANEMQNLVNQPYKSLIILGCNAGHYDYRAKNIASEFAKKAAYGSPPVMASDGTVTGRWWPSGNYMCTNSERFRYWREEATPGSIRITKGWVTYQYNKINKTFAITSWTNNRSLNITGMLNKIFES